MKTISLELKKIQVSNIATGMMRIADKADDEIRTLLASVPLLLTHGVSYRLEAQAEGGRLTLSLDGVQLINAVDTALAAGRVGLNVFDGRAACQDVTVTALP